MNASLKGKLALAFLLVFVAGAATGVFLGLHHLQHHMIFGPPHSGDVPDRMREHLRRALSLTAEQENKVAPIVDATSTKLETIRVETAERVRTVMEDSKREIAPLLTPEQQKKLEKLESEHRKMMHHHGFLPPPPPKEKPPSPSP
jgi:Spy/CpxP family protein refolding chaperone